MATQLERTTTMFKKGFVGCIIIIFACILFDWISGKLNPRQTQNPLIIEPDNKFGALPQLTFDSLKLAEGSNPQYSLEITEFPKLPPVNVVYVYKFKKPKVSLTAEDEASTIARNLGFRESPQSVGENSTILRWTSESGTRILTYNTLTKQILLLTDYKKDPLVKEDHEIPPDLDLFKTNARNFLENREILPDDFNNDLQSAEFLKLDDNFNFIQADSSAAAQYVRVYLYRQIESFSITDIPESTPEDVKEWYNEQTRISNIIKPNPKEGPIMIIFGNSGTNPDDIFEMNYIHWEVDKSSDSGIAKYAIIDKDTALEKIQKGEGAIRYLVTKNTDPNATYTPLDVSTFYIYNLELAYIETEEFTDYLQPVYYCTGEALLENREEAEFIIYYPAIDYDKIPT